MVFVSARPHISRESACDSHLCFYGSSSSSSTINEFTARHLPLELRFTPVNSTSENSEPVKRTSNVLSSKCSGTSHQRHARNCRLIGFTPLIEEVFTTSEEDSIQFLGPRHVKAKEVAPCALFYKRADVFVSSEMKSQNILALSESHYCKMQSGDEVSVKKLEYADQHSDHSREVAEPSINLGDERPMKSFREDRFGLKVNLEMSCAHREPVCQTFAKDGLTSIPLESNIQPGFQFDGKPFHIYAGDTDSPLTSISRAEQNIPWEAGSLASDPERSTSSIDSCGIQSNLWDSIIASSSRATSPTSSIYSSISPSCHIQPITTSAVQDQCAQSRCKLTKLSLLRLNAEQENKQNSLDQGLFGIPDWWEDNGSLADDENDSSTSSIQIQSDDD